MKYFQVTSENRRFIYLIEDRENDKYAILAFHDILNGIYSDRTAYWTRSPFQKNMNLFRTGFNKSSRFIRKLSYVRKLYKGSTWKRVTKRHVLTELL